MDGPNFSPFVTALVLRRAHLGFWRLRHTHFVRATRWRWGRGSAEAVFHRGEEEVIGWAFGPERRGAIGRNSICVICDDLRSSAVSKSRCWVPACAGMTGWGGGVYWETDASACLALGALGAGDSED